MKLKPCPFCGSGAIKDKTNKIIYCTGCIVTFNGSIYDTIEDMVEQWNKRVEY